MTGTFSRAQPAVIVSLPHPVDIGRMSGALEGFSPVSTVATSKAIPEVLIALWQQTPLPCEGQAKKRADDHADTRTPLQDNLDGR